jgi:molybdopterin-guanine dinucleotide biosynthesis protein B
MRVIGLAGWSGAGKTTLLTAALPKLVARGIKVSTVKHAHHEFDIDRPGKDSYRHREAGATEVLISSSVRYALMHELKGEPELTLSEILARMSPVDLVVVEGFKRDGHPKLEVHRAANDKPLLHPNDPSIVAIATDVAGLPAPIPVMSLDDIDRIVDVLLTRSAILDRLPLGAGARNGTTDR